MTKLLLFFGTHKRFQNDFARRYGAVFLFAVFTSLSAFSQQIDIKGKVLEENTKATVIGATVKVKGQKVGTVTNANGDFNLNVKTLPTTLVVSVTGFKSQEIDVYEAEPTTIYLAEDQNRLSALVVVGYGTQKRSELTGSISSIPVPGIKESAQLNFVNSLQGLASGIQVTQTSGAPGGSSSVRIRGGNSITGGNEPLYVIDGFPVYSTNLSDINPNDIETIDILKDASATAIYGSRGANGVIVITTKKGSRGKGTVSYDGSVGFQQVSHKIGLLNAKQWGIYKNDALINNGKSPLFSAAQLDSLGQNSTDWQASALRNAPVRNHQITVSGGSDKTRYSASIGAFLQDGILIGSSFDRYSGRINLDSKVSEKFNFGFNVNGSYSINNNTSSITSLLYIPPTVPVYDNSGKYTFLSPYESAIANPIASADLSTNATNTLRVFSSSFGEYEIIKGLKAKVLLGIDLSNYKQNRYTPSTLYEGSSVSGSASIDGGFSRNILNENTLTYTKNFKKNNLELLAGFTQQESVKETVGASAKTFTNDIVEYNDLSSGSTLVKPSSNYEKWALKSYLGRVNYNYDQRYFFTASLRADGSSRLGENNRWGYFPSGSVAWQATNESFLKDFSRSIKLNNLKVRLSAGKTGNQEITPYQSEALLTGYSYPTGSGTTTLTGFAPSQIPNPNLKWETTAQYDGGVDIGFFNDRIKLTFDAYYKKTSDLLLAVAVPVTSGYASSVQNIGSVENKGLEFSLNTENVKTKNFSWNTDFNISFNRNKVLSLNEGVTQLLVASEVQTGNVIVVGQSLGSFWGYKTDGIYRDASEIPAIPLLANTKVGDVKYVDLGGNADGTPDGKITQAGDQTVIGNAQPKFIFGFTNNFSYKNFDLSVFFQGTYGNKIYSYIIQQLMVPTGYQNVIAGFADHYTSTNTTAQYQRPNELITTNAVSDLYVFDGSFLRLKSLTLGYNLPKKLAKSLKIEKARIYASGSNLLTLTTYPGFDPEVNSYSTNSSRQGVDTGSYPTAKSYTLGLSITF
jgi:TonB-dependent starch-binding outer membrane protein SusC